MKAGLEAKKTGNELMTVIGGREIHPVSLCVGGFYKVPAKRDLNKLARARCGGHATSRSRRCGG